MIGRRAASPGRDPARKEPDTVEAVPVEDIHPGAARDRFINPPDLGRVGVCCSGGGIRSASYNLGVLQVLRRKGVLQKAEYLAAVSGGAYIATAHQILIRSTLREQPTCENPGCRWVRRSESGDNRHDDNALAFRDLAPWAPGSPEERHLRDRLSYIAPGFRGKVWLAVVFVYGAVGHVLPFLAGLVFAGSVSGLALSQWIRPTFKGTDGHVPIDYGRSILLAGVFIVLAVLCLIARHLQQQRRRPSGTWLDTLQWWTLSFLLFALGVGIVLAGVPWFFEWVHSHRPLSRFSRSPLTSLLFAAGAGLLAFAASSLLKRGRALLGRVLGTVATLTFVLFPFVGFAFWNAQGNDPVGRLRWTLGAAAVLVIYLFLDETTPVTHHFYRERLSTAFVGRRRRRCMHPGCAQTYEQLPWRDPVNLSTMTPPEPPVAHATMPKLVICAAVNLSRDVPPGRNAGSFTFERDFSGGPMTGYIPTCELEQAAPVGTTMPAMMAISGAAISPSMGKMTRPSFRFLMAVFNVRLGIWLPNPMKGDWRTASQTSISEKELAGRRRCDDDEPRKVLQPIPKNPIRRPGLGYVLLEALGVNTLDRKFVYVTDGGHYDNLGLVELLRRGCGQILCFDAAGDDIRRFNTLSEAIALAKSELGVDIRIDCGPLRPPETSGSRRGEPAHQPWSNKDHVVGTIEYPGCNERGLLIFAKATVTRDAPQDLKSYQERDPKFPNHPTSDQFFNDERFEMYRSLGALAAERVVKRCNEERGRVGLEPILEEGP